MAGALFAGELMRGRFQLAEDRRSHITLSRGVCARTRFVLATADAEAGIRALLRRSPLAGAISLSLEREPDYFADAHLPGETRQTIVAEEDGRVVCAGHCAIRRRFVNGAPRLVGYLGGLRLAPELAGRFDILRRGYACFHQLQAQAPAEFYFTSIASDNARARRFLERALPGMPRYEFLAEYVTVLMPVRPGFPKRAPADRSALAAGVDEFITHLNDPQQRHQFTLCSSAEELTALQPLGLREQDIRVVRRDGHVRAAAILWDQRAFKQTVIRGYAPWLATVRPLVNAVARLAGGPRLPRVGESVAHAFAAYLAGAPEDTEATLSVVAELSALAEARGLEYLTAGFAANDPRLAALRRACRGREYRSRIYLVHWPDAGQPARALDGRLIAPEAAWL